MIFDTEKLICTWIPQQHSISPEQIEIIMQPHTEWPRTYYHF